MIIIRTLARIVVVFRRIVMKKDSPTKLLRTWICSQPSIGVTACRLIATVETQKLGTTLMLLFGTMALLLAAVGIYGKIAYASAERRSEVATRMALSGLRSNIFWLLSRQGLIVAAAGATIGLGIAYGIGRLASSWLYEVRSSDPLILASALSLVLAVTIVATLIPVGRAARVDPALSLRFE